VIYVFAMWNSGLVQGLMWRTYTESGTLAYSFLDSLVAMQPYYVARAIGGLLYMIGGFVGAYNVWKTIKMESPVGDRVGDLPLKTAAAVLQPAE
jgi:cytochrome c oxidase cbb3-type subunit 1